MSKDIIVQQSEEIKGIFEECDLGTRLSEIHPEAFEKYMDLFVRYFPRKNYHTKKCYAEGWPQPKIKSGPRKGQSATLIDSGKYLAMTETAERHLDYWHWAYWKAAQNPNTEARTPLFPQFWFGQQAPTATDKENIDIDSHRLIGYYRLGETQPLRPCVWMPLEHFQMIQKVYDAFPARLWCISSESLGLHVWKFYNRRLPLDLLRQPVLGKLAALGYPQIEVHPMPGRCQRRPCGKDSRIITADGLVTAWEQQVAVFSNPPPPPSFERIVKVLLGLMSRQWRLYIEKGDHKEGHLYASRQIEKHYHHLKEVQDWLAAGCPQHTKTVEPELVTAPLATRKIEKAIYPPAIDINDICNSGNWVQTVTGWASSGLPVPDSLYPVTAELAKWLVWIELYRYPLDERTVKVSRLLVQYLKKKHNGMSDRIINGDLDVVEKQVNRIVQEVVDHGDTKTWEKIRSKRDSGKYKQLILLAPTMAAQLPEQQLKLGSALSVSSSPPVERDIQSSLPLIVEESILRVYKDKRYKDKIINFANKLLNHLHEQGGEATVSQKTLAEYLGYHNPTQINKYKQILIKAGVLKEGGYKAHARSRRYVLLVKAAFDIQHQRKAEKVS